ncbi:hypothetical protein [Nocardioides marmorisolisilvae]|uniref:Uncharacterized protein n=1 Tax=Nocardioides marmorisolisilvae TaxID=1542737 RepID=A0A3N0DWR6_9ACTN|nr:hypothetical protein [Nocardioides marmorisolisilvae]RNL80049.1 hypothetical protein EFL95_14120 [Nocardioides marmorisolisilvae]
MPDADLAASRWRGQRGRLEVWYSTLTDPSTGTGIWVHHELVVPSDDRAPYGHGWIAVFRPDRAPVLERFGPHPWATPASGFTAGAVEHVADRLSGTAGAVRWDLRTVSAGPPMFTFPSWAWHQELLPAAQVVPEPQARFNGTVRIGEDELVLDGAVGANARIYGHGNGLRWGWLHADLGDGEVCEVVTAISKRAGLRRLPALAQVQLRLNGEPDRPGDPLVAALGQRTRLHRDGWTVKGRLGGGRRLEIDVRLPEDQTLDVSYLDPDGRMLVCRNSERAQASIKLLRREGGSWVAERDWFLGSTAHAEAGGF